jgi:hypothetical protein
MVNHSILASEIKETQTKEGNGGRRKHRTKAGQYTGEEPTGQIIIPKIPGPLPTK